jgi:hypothetical protein
VRYLGAGGMELLVGGKLTVGFLASNHTDADVGAWLCVCVCVFVCLCFVLGGGGVVVLYS